MKKFIVIGILVIVGGVGVLSGLAYMQVQANDTALEEIRSKDGVVELSITGMTWGVGCTLSVRDALLESSNVKSAAVDYDKGVAYILPEGEFTSKEADGVFAKDDKYTAKIN